MELSLSKPNISLNHLLLHVKDAIETEHTFSPTIIHDLETLLQSLKDKTSKNSYLYDGSNKTLFFNDKPIKLCYKEILFLELLIHHQHRIVTYAELQHHVWQDTVMTDNSIRSLVRNLRKKLPDGMIENYSKTGYKFSNQLTSKFYYKQK